MSKMRTNFTQNAQHKRAEEFNQKLEKGAETAAVHRAKVQQSEHDAQFVAEPGRGHGHSQAAHLSPDKPIKPQEKRPIGDPNAGHHPGALLKR